MMQPLVSVIIPTYNRPHFLKETLNSVSSQTYINIEIIVVDDGTPSDENETLCLEYKNLNYIKINNTGGPATPRNVGISNSNGKYIAFVDDDDLWLPKKIEVQVNILENNQDFDLVHCSCHVIDENGIKTGEIIGKPKNTIDKHGDVLTRMIGNWTIMMPTPLIRKNIVSKVGLFNENIPPALEDVEYWSRCAFHAKFYYIDEPLVNYRKHSNNISTSKKKYINLPLYLNEVINQNRNMVSIKVYKKLVLNICLMQSKMIKTDFLKTLSNMFKINPFWFVNFRVQKTIIKKLIS
jgi:glycosyltransferase domain-containing protein